MKKLFSALLIFGLICSQAEAGMKLRNQNNPVSVVEELNAGSGLVATKTNLVGNFALDLTQHNIWTGEQDIDTTSGSYPYGMHITQAGSNNTAALFESYDTGVYAISTHGTAVLAYANTGEGMNVNRYSNQAGASNKRLVDIQQLSATDAQDVLYLKQVGTGNIINAVAGSTSVFTVSATGATTINDSLTVSGQASSGSAQIAGPLTIDASGTVGAHPVHITTGGFLFGMPVFDISDTGNTTVYGNLSLVNTGGGSDITTAGNVTAASLIKTGGTSSQFLKADGSVDSTVYGTGDWKKDGSGGTGSGTWALGGTFQVQQVGNSAHYLSIADDGNSSNITSTDFITLNPGTSKAVITGSNCTSLIPSNDGYQDLGYHDNTPTNYRWRNIWATGTEVLGTANWDGVSKLQVGGLATASDFKQTASGTVNRDGNGRISSVAKTGGRTLTVASRDANNRISTITDGTNTWTISRTNGKITSWVVS